MRPQLLVVDDAPESRALLSRPFERRGMDVVQAADGAAALRLMETSRFDAALLDISMPGLSGLEVLREIRTRHSQSSLPVIMVTGRAGTDDVMVAFRLGASDYVTKPVDVPVLVARVLTQVSRKRTEERLERALGDLTNVNLELREETRRRAESEARAWDLAHHDPLTGVRNRLRFWTDLTSTIARVEAPQGFALLCLDLDGFKEVNDTLGHQVGDELLRAVADRIRGCLAEGDAVARLGGDEFAVLQSSLRDAHEAGALAERLIEVVSLPAAIAQHEIAVGCSVGIAFASARTVEAEVLMRQADTALYAAKSGGRGTWRTFAPET